jgi:hypothetical protein
MVQSERTGNYYATIKQASISATFDEEMAKRMLGKQLPGTIERIEVEPYEIETDSGTVKLYHRWVYRQDNQEIPAEVEKESSVIELAETAKKRKNGVDKIAV